MPTPRPPRAGVRFSPFRSSTLNLGRHAQRVSSLMRNYCLASGVVVSNHITAVVDTQRPPLPLAYKGGARAVPPRFPKWFQRAKGGGPRTKFFVIVSSRHQRTTGRAFCGHGTRHPHAPPPTCVWHVHVRCQPSPLEVVVRQPPTTTRDGFLRIPPRSFQLTFILTPLHTPAPSIHHTLLYPRRR